MPNVFARPLGLPRGDSGAVLLPGVQRGSIREATRIACHCDVRTRPGGRHATLHVDDFETGVTTLGWSGGGGASHVASGGPASMTTLSFK